MAFDFKDLNGEVRRFMLVELESDEQNGKIYISGRLNKTGQSEYAKLLRKALANGNEESLAQDLRSGNYFNPSEIRNIKGQPTSAKVPITAPDTLAEGEFNRYFIRGLCKFAIESGIKQVQVYRAKHVSSPRPESERLIGSFVDAQRLLEGLRSDSSVDNQLGVPAGPNSGLSIRLPEQGLNKQTNAS